MHFLIINSFRVSRLAALAREHVHTLADSVRPRLAAHGFGIADEIREHRRDRRSGHGIQAHHTADISVVFELVLAQHVPIPADGTGLIVIERRARVAIMHRERREVVGNIHLIRGAEMSSSRWTFAKGGLFSGGTNSDNKCLVRFTGDVEAHTLVVELSYLLAYVPDRDTSGTRTESAGVAQSDISGSAHRMTFEMSCGWTGIDLGDVSQLAGKSHDQLLAGGCPTDVIAVDLHPVVPGAGRTQRSGSFLRRGLTKHAPAVSFRFSTPKESLARLADDLPTSIVVDLLSVPLLTAFRACVLDSLASTERLREPGAAAGVVPMYDPAMATFLELCTNPITFGVFRNQWRAECKLQSHRTKRRHCKHALRHMLTERAIGLV